MMDSYPVKLSLLSNYLGGGIKSCVQELKGEKKKKKTLVFFHLFKLAPAILCYVCLYICMYNKPNRITVSSREPHFAASLSQSPS